MKLIWTGAGIASTLLLCGCLASIPSTRVRAETPEPVRDVFRRSSESYLSEAESALALARSAPDEATARSHLSKAWLDFESAWARETLTGEFSGLLKVIRATALAQTPVNIADGIDEGLALFGSMMRKVRNADPAVHSAGELESFMTELHAGIDTNPASFTELKRAFAIEREIWRTADDGAATGPHLAHLAAMLDHAESSTELRGKVPFKWLQDAAADLRIRNP